MRLVIFKKPARDMTTSVTAQQQRLILTSLFVANVEIVNDISSSGEDFGALDRGAFDYNFIVRTASVKGGVDFVIGVVVVERILHFVAIEKIMTISKNLGGIDSNLMLAKDFGNESLLFF